eukprot:scaffold900_cov430-Prasinococcus_capsulatus_cf.AAC.4
MHDFLRALSKPERPLKNAVVLVLIRIGRVPAVGGQGEVPIATDCLSEGKRRRDRNLDEILAELLLSILLRLLRRWRNFHTALALGPGVRLGTRTTACNLFRVAWPRPRAFRRCPWGPEPFMSSGRCHRRSLSGCSHHPRAHWRCTGKQAQPGLEFPPEGYTSGKLGGWPSNRREQQISPDAAHRPGPPLQP